MTEEENVTSIADHPEERRSLDTFATDRFAREEEEYGIEKSYLDDEVSLRSEESGNGKAKQRGRQSSLSTVMTTPTKVARVSSSRVTSLDDLDATSPEEETKDQEVMARRSSRRR